jgi:hypothetical protein
MFFKGMTKINKLFIPAPEFRACYILLFFDHCWRTKSSITLMESELEHNHLAAPLMSLTALAPTMTFRIYDLKKIFLNIKFQLIFNNLNIFKQREKL